MELALLKDADFKQFFEDDDAEEYRFQRHRS